MLLLWCYIKNGYLSNFEELEVQMSHPIGCAYVTSVELKLFGYSVVTIAKYLNINT